MRLCGDDWMAKLGLDLFDDATRDRLEVLFWEHAQDLLRLGQNVILESGFWLRADRDEKRIGGRALGARVELYLLDVPLDELWRRIDRRNAQPPWDTEPILREHLDEWVSYFDTPTDDELRMFDPPSRPLDPS